MSHARRVSGGEKNVSFRERALQAISVMDDWRCPIDEQTSRKVSIRSPLSSSSSSSFSSSSSMVGLMSVNKDDIHVGRAMKVVS